MGEGRNPAPPARVWLGTLGILVMLAAAWVAVFTRFDAAQRPQFGSLNRARIRSFAARPEPLKVVALGRSSLRWGVSAEELEQRSRAGGPELALLKISSRRGTLRDFEPLLDPLLEFDPALLMIELGLVVEDRARTFQLRVGVSYLRWRLFGAGPWRALGGPISEEQREPGACPGGTRPGELSARRTGVLEYAPDGPSVPLARDFIRRAARRSIVALLVFPRTGEMAPFAVEHDTPTRELIGELTADPRVSFLPFTGELHDPGFCDPVHLSPSGRSEYTAWLFGRIAEQLRE